MNANFQSYTDAETYVANTCGFELSDEEFTAVANAAWTAHDFDLTDEQNKENVDAAIIVALEELGWKF